MAIDVNHLRNAALEPWKLYQATWTHKGVVRLHYRHTPRGPLYRVMVDNTQIMQHNDAQIIANLFDRCTKAGGQDIEEKR